MTLSNPHDALGAYDVASRAEWLATGLSARQLRTLEEKGALVRLHHGAYATAQAVENATDPAARHALLARSVAAALNGGHVLSHESAATIHHLDLLHPPSAVTLTRSSGRNQQRNGVRIRSAAVPGRHVTTIGGTRVTTPARTVADLARSLPFMDAVVVADSAIRRSKASKPQVRDVLRTAFRWPGTSDAERAVDFSSGKAESVLESCARVVFHEAGLPTPQLQAEFIDHRTLASARVDFYWPEYKTAAEADGMLKYDDNPRAARNQFKRDQMLRDKGLKVAHFTWRELFDHPETVIARVRKAFAAPSPW